MRNKPASIALALTTLVLAPAIANAQPNNRVPDGTIVGKDYIDQFGQRREGPMFDCYDCDPRKRRDNNTWSPRRHLPRPDGAPRNRYNPNTNRWEQY